MKAFLLFSLLSLVATDELMSVVLIVGGGEQELDLEHRAGPLTKAAMLQAYDTGAYLRELYETAGLILDGQIDGDLPTYQVHAESVARPANLMSAATLLAGMFPPSEGQVFVEGLNWQPFPVYQSRVLDTVFEECAARKQIQATENINSLEISEFILDNSVEIQTLYSALGYEGADIQMLDRLYSIYLYETAYNLTHTECVEDHIALVTLAHDIIWRNKVYWSSDSLRVFTGMVLKKISSVFTESQKFIDVRPKLRIYSSDDSTLAEVQTALGLYLGVRPAPHTVLHFELWNNELDIPKYYVKVRVSTDNVTLQSFVTTDLTLPSCSDLQCDAATFLSKLEEVAITSKEFESLCAPKNSLLDTFTQRVMVVTGSVVTVITLFCLAYYLSRRSQGYPLTNGSNRWNKLLDEQEDY